MKESNWGSQQRRGRNEECSKMLPRCYLEFDKSSFNSISPKVDKEERERER